MSLFSEVLPQWDSVGVEPSGAKKTAGWQVNEKPPADWFNWLFHRIFKCIEEIRTVIDGSTAAPTGAMMKWPKSTPPTGWLKRNGAAISRTTYAALFAVIGTDFGVGDGATTFNLPDDRGYYERNWDDSRGIDTGRVFGSYQADDNKSHGHTASSGTESATHTHTTPFSLRASSPGGLGGTIPDNTTPGTTGTESATHTHSITINATGSTEVTVKSRAYLPIIKY